MFKIINLTFVLLFLSPFCLRADPISVLEEFDLRTYRPDNHGLKDLMFDIRSPELFEELKSNEALGKLVDVYVKVYWTSPGRYRLIVEGLPKGFSNIEESIKNNMKPFLEFVIAERVAPKFRSYKLTSKKEGKKIMIVGDDESGSKPVVKIEATLDNKMRLLKIGTDSIRGKMHIDFDYSVKSWSHNKWSVDKAVTVAGNNITKIVTTQTVAYDQVAGFGMPKKVSVGTKIINSNKQVGLESKKTYLFSGYAVNSGKAQHVITK